MKKDICNICHEIIWNKRKNSDYCESCFEMKEEYKRKIHNILVPCKLKHPKFKFRFKLMITKR